MAKKRRRSRGSRPPGGGTATAVEEGARSRRAEHKELARQRREQERKRAKRRRFVRTYLILVGISAVSVSIIILVMGPRSTPSGPLPGLLKDTAPWPANTAQVGARLDRLDLPAAGGAEHIHVDLQIFVKGSAEPVPADIGLASGVESPLHTHESGGVFHVESATQRTFTVGNVFDVWGVRLTRTCLGGYCDSGAERLRAYVNGSPITGSPRDVALADHDVVVLTFGTSAQEPTPIPSTYDWSTLNP
jgi:hypothetical protein